MKKIFLLLLITLPLYLSISLYFLDKKYFLCPIEYKWDLVIRCDGRGDGFFGAKRNGQRMHTGIDLLAQINTPVLASRSGKVISATQNKGMGKYIIIRHPNNFITIYGHLLAIYVVKNEFVRQGQVIARVGKTGNANFRDVQPHLHFEIRKDGIPQDPLEYLE
jgi:murein DD-endopeptidase MepM/ murein hydrolase activator NlpD